MSGSRSFTSPAPGRSHRPYAVLSFAVLLSLAATVVCAPGAVGAQKAELEEGRGIVDPHNYLVRTNCVLCHTSRPPELSFDPVTTCTKCHSANVGNHPVVRHPIGKAPKTHVPSSMPLSPKGELVCYTCHDYHNKSTHPKMLRVGFLKLCSACHPGY